MTENNVENQEPQITQDRYEEIIMRANEVQASEDSPGALISVLNNPPVGFELETQILVTEAIMQKHTNLKQNSKKSYSAADKEKLDLFEQGLRDLSDEEKSKLKEAIEASNEAAEKAGFGSDEQFNEINAAINKLLE